MQTGQIKKLFQRPYGGFLWPLFAVCLIVLLWVATYFKLDHEKALAKSNAMLTVSSVSRAYAEQLTRSLVQFDQITLNIKYYWRQTNGVLRIEDQQQAGLYPKMGPLLVGIINRNGDLISSTFPIGEPINFYDKPWFTAVKDADNGQLLIYGPEPGAGKLGSTQMIRFVRRLETTTGEFDGVVTVSVEPAYLGALYEEINLGYDDFISVRFDSGPVLATKVVGPTRIFYRENPVFTTASGIAEVPNGKFTDGLNRIVAWEKIEYYPLVALIGLSERSIYAAYNQEAQEYRNMATVGSLFILLATLAGMYFSSRLAEKRTREEEVKSIFRLAVDGGREGFYMIRPIYDRTNQPVDFLVEDCNERGASIAGYEKEELVGTRFSDIYSGEQMERMANFFRRSLEAGFYEDEIRVPPQSKLKAAWVHRRAVRSGSGLAMTIRDISDVKAHEIALSNMANADALTALPNRHWLSNFLPVAINQSRENSGCLAILFIDLDNFKNINDMLGHQAGDELLKRAAQRLKRLVRASDHVVRLGGDEFTIVLEQVERLEDVTQVADKIIHALQEPFVLNNTSGHQVQASLGISVFPRDGSDGETLLKHADIAMYAAKAAGKGRYHYYQPHLSDNLILRITKEQALRRAIERNEFVLYYQPRVDTYTGKLCSMEALVRWNHPEHGLVSPIEFIQVAEETGLIITLGEIIIEKACCQIAEWKASKLPIVPVSINVSALQFNRGNVKEVLARCMKMYGIEPSLIGVELTESCMIEDDITVPQELEALRALGVKLLVDDFGTGYSSLAQLQELDVDILKVDRAFTRRLCEGQEGKAFFKAIVSMANALDICIVAEGVETAEQLHVLQALSCEEVQGHLVSKPVPATEMVSLMSKRFLFPKHAFMQNATV
jgi:diguanylate cyclase (GGDEF)-like protein/PAS domain S-box-containing protein